MKKQIFKVDSKDTERFKKLARDFAISDERVNNYKELLEMALAERADARVAVRNLVNEVGDIGEWKQLKFDPKEMEIIVWHNDENGGDLGG